LRPHSRGAPFLFSPKYDPSPIARCRPGNTFLLRLRHDGTSNPQAWALSAATRCVTPTARRQNSTEHPECDDSFIYNGTATKSDYESRHRTKDIKRSRRGNFPAAKPAGPCSARAGKDAARSRRPLLHPLFTILIRPCAPLLPWRMCWASLARAEGAHPLAHAIASVDKPAAPAHGPLNSHGEPRNPGSTQRVQTNESPLG